MLIEAVAGLALLASFGQSLHNALADPQEREAALVTFLVAASGVGFHGIGGAFWGLRRRRRRAGAHALRRFLASTARQDKVNSICAAACAVMVVGS